MVDRIEVHGIEVDRSRVKVIHIDSHMKVTTYGYDDTIVGVKCKKKNEEVVLTRMYREFNIPTIQGRYLYKCNKSEKKITRDDSGEEFTECIRPENCNSRCICYNCLAACGREVNWGDSQLNEFPDKETVQSTENKEINVNQLNPPIKKPALFWIGAILNLSMIPLLFFNVFLGLACGFTGFLLAKSSRCTFEDFK